jgi:hypothetical protein
MFWFSSYKYNPKLSVPKNIIAFMQLNPEKTYKVSDISKVCGYEAGTRVGDLVRRWRVKRVGTEFGKTKRQAFALYSLNH